MTEMVTATAMDAGEKKMFTRVMFDTPEAVFFYRAGVALVIGLFIGLERERAAHEDKHPSFAGIRTFAICSLTGLLCGIFQSAAILTAGFAAVTLIATVAYVRGSKQDQPGITTEAAYVLTYLLGALCARGSVLEAASVTLAATMLLAGKEQLRLFARTLPERDLAAALKFGVISVIILPLVPNREMPAGAWYAVNPYKVWLMVVLMAGIGFVGYILTRIVGPRAGTGLAGLVGGLVSSTAVTLTFSKRSREAPTLARACALAVVAACTVLYVRVFVEALVVNRSFAMKLGIPLAILFALSIGITAWLYRLAKAAATEETGAVPYKNPVELLPAIKFALVFGAVTVIFKGAQKWFGATGTYVAAFLSGLTDMDAVTLSMANMTKAGGVSEKVGVVCVLLGAISNTLVKLGFAISLGSPGMRRLVALALGATCLLATGILLWIHFRM